MSTRRYILEVAASSPAHRIDYGAGLDEEQLAVIEAPFAPLLVIAGAGSGKTRTLIYRLARMLEEGIPPERILLLTFTNRAAREMLERARDLVSVLPGVDVRRIRGGTFHRVANQVLRRFAPALGFEPGFGILDREDQKDLVATCVADLGLSAGPRRFPKAEVVVDLISASVNTQQPLHELVLRRRPQFEVWVEALEAVAQRYRQRKAAMNVMDFDDLLLHWKVLLTDHAEIRALLQDEAQGILVDEYQDTNRLQADIVERLAQKHRNLTAVGDDAQSIYSFRGAELTNILELPARYPGCQVHRLTRNYRSIPEILALANASIAKNVRQFPKELRASRGQGERPVLVPARDAVQQASFLAQRILELRDEGVSLDEVAILYRAHHHSMEVQFELSRRGIPFKIRSGARFFEHAHVKDVLAFLRVAHNPADELSFLRMVRLFPGIGSKTAGALWGAFRAAAGSTAERVAHPDLELAAGRAQVGWKRCAQLLGQLAQPPASDRPGEGIEAILAGGYEEWLVANHANAQARVEDIQQLAAYARQFSDLESFLSEVSLLSELGGQDVEEEDAPDEHVTLSSIHRAKGLEWKVVFVVWLAEGAFPTPMATREPLEEEEERRCFYVAVTRAKDELYLTHPLLAAPRDGERVILRPSRFLAELMQEGAEPWERWTLEEAPVAAPATLSRDELQEAARRLLGSDAEGTSTEGEPEEGEG